MLRWSDVRRHPGVSSTVLSSGAGKLRKQIVNGSWDNLRGSESRIGDLMLLHAGTRTVQLGSTEVLVMVLGHTGCTACWLTLVAQLVKNPPAMQQTTVRFLGWEDLLEKE